MASPLVLLFNKQYQEKSSLLYGFKEVFLDTYASNARLRGEITEGVKGQFNLFGASASLAGQRSVDTPLHKFIRYHNRVFNDFISSDSLHNEKKVSDRARIELLRRYDAMMPEEKMALPGDTQNMLYQFRVNSGNRKKWNDSFYYYAYGEVKPAKYKLRHDSRKPIERNLNVGLFMVNEYVYGADLSSKLRSVISFIPKTVHSIAVLPELVFASLEQVTGYLALKCFSTAAALCKKDYFYGAVIVPALLAGVGLALAAVSAVSKLVKLSYRAIISPVRSFRLAAQHSKFLAGVSALVSVAAYAVAGFFLAPLLGAASLGKISAFFATSAGEATATAAAGVATMGLSAAFLRSGARPRRLKVRKPLASSPRKASSVASTASITSRLDDFEDGASGGARTPTRSPSARSLESFGGFSSVSTGSHADNDPRSGVLQNLSGMWQTVPKPEPTYSLGYFNFMELSALENLCRIARTNGCLQYCGRTKDFVGSSYAECKADEDDPGLCDSVQRGLMNAVLSELNKMPLVLRGKIYDVQPVNMSYSFRELFGDLSEDSLESMLRCVVRHLEENSDDQTKYPSLMTLLRSGERTRDHYVSASTGGQAEVMGASMSQEAGVCKNFAGVLALIKARVAEQKRSDDAYQSDDGLPGVAAPGF